MNHSIIIGVDSAGDGALAGPVVVAAAAFLRSAPVVQRVFESTTKSTVLTVDDSKKIKKPEHRLALAQAIRSQAAATAIITRSSEEIDTYLISRVVPEAIRLAISRVLEKLSPQFPSPKDYLVLLDGDLEVPSNIPCEVRPIAQGDAKHWQIGAASILAKVDCDMAMAGYAERYPVYDFAHNLGYPTPDHKKRLKAHGACPVHRKTFKPVQAVRPLPKGASEL